MSSSNQKQANKIRYYNQILTNAIWSEKPGEVMASHDNFIIFKEELISCCSNSFYSSCETLKIKLFGCIFEKRLDFISQHCKKRIPMKKLLRHLLQNIPN